MNFLIVLFYIWSGFLGHTVNYLKQFLFQGKNVTKTPLVYLKDLKFLGSVIGVMGITQVTWIVDALLRERLKLSETYAYTALISAPISVIVMLSALWLSEKNLSDKIVWWAAGLMIVGTALSMIGGAFMLSGHK